MSEESSQRRIERTDDHGRPVAAADLHLDPDASTAVAAVHVEAGHRPPGTTAGLVDEVVDAPEVRDAERVVAVVPRGEAEALHQAQQRLADPAARAAGASVIIEGQPPADPPTDDAPTS